MIRRTVSAALLLRDGFTGAVLKDFSATRCLLDGRPLSRPIWKRDGYLILTDLAPGEHLLLICRSGYRDETVPLQIREGAPLEDTVSLKPGKGYRFPPETARVSLALRRGKVPAAGETVWLGLQPRARLKLAQEKTDAGDNTAHLFCEGNASLLPIPGHFLLTDQAPELVFLRSLHEETGEFFPPMALSHSRGALFVPVQPYRADDLGCVQVLLREPGTLNVFCGGAVRQEQLTAGEQKLEWKLED